MTEAVTAAAAITMIVKALAAIMKAVRRLNIYLYIYIRIVCIFIYGGIEARHSVESTGNLNEVSWAY